MIDLMMGGFWVATMTVAVLLVLFVVVPVLIHLYVQIAVGAVCAELSRHKGDKNGTIKKKTKREDIGGSEES